MTFGRSKLDIGFGLGLRPVHYPAILDGATGIDWFEIISENYMIGGGQAIRNLMRVRDRYPLVMHGVSLSIGSTDPLNQAYLRDLASLAARVEPLWISDHLCWTGVAGLNMHDLLPLPYTEEALAHVASRVQAVQDHLKRPILIENVSSYVTYSHSTMPEWEFLVELSRRAGCGLLLDVNNVYVSAFNHEFDPRDYLDAIPADLVGQIHLAGHQNNGTHLIDTHDHPVVDAVWRLYRHVIGRFGMVPTMIERDDDIPPLETLIAELDAARSIAREAIGERARSALVA